MRFMIMHKNDPHTEAGHPPPMELVTRMGAFIGITRESDPSSSTAPVLAQARTTLHSSSRGTLRRDARPVPR